MCRIRWRVTLVGEPLGLPVERIAQGEEATVPEWVADKAIEAGLAERVQDEQAPRAPKRAAPAAREE
jgi:hypothetical protein